MKEEGATMTAITTPSIGPTIMVFLGIKFVPAALALGLLGLFLSRYIAPKSTRRLTKRQEWALTGMLALMLVVIVTGDFPLFGAAESPGDGMAPACAVCLTSEDRRVGHACVTTCRLRLYPHYSIQLNITQSNGDKMRRLNTTHK